MPALAYKRVLLKVSGELLGSRGRGIEPQKITSLVAAIKAARRQGAQIGIVMGGGNWWRKRDNSKQISALTSDYIGMLGTVSNSLALKDILQQSGVETIVQSFLVTLPGVAKVNTVAARKSLAQGKVIIFAGGTGKPFVTTDTAAAERARDIKAQAIFKVGEVDGVYTADPDKNKRAVKYYSITFTQAMNKRLKIFDLGAYKICRQAKIPVVVFKWSQQNLSKALAGKSVGTKIY